MNIFRLIFNDYKRFVVCDQTTGLKVIFFTQGFGALLCYRVARTIYVNIKAPWIRHFLLIFMYLWRKIIEITTNIYIPWQAEIGTGLHIAHFGLLILHPQTKMGDYCTLSQGVTIGVKEKGNRPGVPSIGDRVFIGPNAILIGGIDVANDVLVGAGAVVTNSVPERAVVAGNPAKIISYKGSFDYIQYDGMEKDSKRLASLALIAEPKNK